jgi:hypothetical protein
MRTPWPWKLRRLPPVRAWRTGARGAGSVPFKAMRFALLAVVMVLGMGGSRAIAQPQIPATFYGAASVQGQTPAPDSEVRAFIGALDCTQLAPGQRTFGIEGGVGVYVVTVVHESQKTGCGKEGKQVTFKINGVEANQTAVWKTGLQQLDLNVGRGVPQQLPTPTPGAVGTPLSAATAAQTGSGTPSTAAAGVTRPLGTPPVDPITLTPASKGLTPRPGQKPPEPPETGSGSVAGNPALWAVLGVLVVLGAGGGVLVSRKWPARPGGGKHGE